MDLLNAHERVIKNQRIEGYRYFFIAPKFPSYPHLTFIYARDISEFDTFLISISRVFVIVSVVLCVILGISIYTILK